MTYDLIIIGAGPGGYIAAERAGAKGLKVLLIEKNKLGGVCLNEGCIPSKTLLNGAKLYYYATHGEVYGVEVEGASFNYDKVTAKKEKVMDTLRGGIAGLMKKFKVEVIFGEAKLTADKKVTVDGNVFDGANIIIGTGSRPIAPPIPGIDLPHVVDSTGILNLTAPPKKLAIVGGGVIGCEFACFFGSIGVPVTVFEMLPEICPPVDPEIAKVLRGELKNKNIDFKVGAAVKAITETGVDFEMKGKAGSVEADLVLVATGRAPNVNDLGLEDARVDFDRRGIKIDDRCATNIPGIYAIGDVTGKVWLAHAASRMGEVVVNNILGRPDRMRYEAIPGVVYTNPEVAAVGLTEKQAEEQGIAVVTAKMPMTANGRYLAEHDGERGMVKVVVDAKTRVLLGVHMVGGACSEMIFGAASMIETELRISEIEEIVFPHPTTSEIIRDTLFHI
jgi:dihydrolipoamide dehydrogenase